MVYERGVAQGEGVRKGCGGVSDTYEEWLAQAERTMRKMKKLGVPTVRLPVMAAELQAWCWAEGVPNTSANRAAFVARRLEKLRASGREAV